MTKIDDVFKSLDKFKFLKGDRSGSLIFSDIDGTLSNIAKTPESATVEESVKDVLNLLAASFRVALVTGRPVEEAKAMVGIDDIIYLANHGLDSLIDGDLEKMESLDDKIAIERSITALISSGALMEGMTYEDKGLSLAVHYRLTSDVDRSREQLLDILTPIAEDHGMALIKGRMVIEMKSNKSNKGVAVLNTIERFRPRNVIYIGDDTTDVDAFKAINRLREESLIKGYSIGVISNETPPEVIDRSDFTLSSVSEVERFFRWLTDDD